MIAHAKGLVIAEITARKVCACTGSGFLSTNAEEFHMLCFRLVVGLAVLKEPYEFLSICQPLGLGIPVCL